LTPVFAAVDEDIPAIFFERGTGEPSAVAKDDHLVFDGSAPASVSRYQLARLGPVLAAVIRFDQPGFPVGNRNADLEE